MNVYKAINAVQSELAKHGIGKDSENKFDGYKFRGIDAVYNAVSPLLAKHGLCILPRMLSRTCEERVSQKGGALFYVTVEAEFDFVAAEDGSKHTVKTYGEAMDRGDKATNKAMSAAYKYAAFQAFAIPTEADDADASSHEVKLRDTSINVRQHVTEQETAELSADEKQWLRAAAEEIIADGDAHKAAVWIAQQSLNTGELLFLSAQLPHELQTAVKKAMSSPPPPPPNGTRAATGAGLKKTFTRKPDPDPTNHREYDHMDNPR